METSSNMLELLLNTDSSGRSLDVRRWREESGVLLGRIWFLWQLMSLSGSGVMHVAHEVKMLKPKQKMRAAALYVGMLVFLDSCRSETPRLSRRMRRVRR